jgi:hypothetical protein
MATSIWAALVPRLYLLDAERRASPSSEPALTRSYLLLGEGQENLGDAIGHEGTQLLAVNGRQSVRCGCERSSESSP